MKEPLHDFCFELPHLQFEQRVLTFIWRSLFKILKLLDLSSQRQRVDQFIFVDYFQRQN